MSDNNEQSKEYIFEHFADYKGSIIEWANNGDERAKDTIYCNPDHFEKTLFKRADDGDIKAQKFLIENYKANRWNNKESFINQAIRSGCQWVINFICTNISEFKENIINVIKNRNHLSFHYHFDDLKAENFDVNFLNEIFQLTNNGNKDATEIAQYIAETEIISHYLKNGNPEIIKDFIRNYWPKDKNHANEFNNFMEERAIEGDEDAQEHIINSLYQYMDRNDPYYNFVVRNYHLDWLHDFICEWWGGELEKIFFEWVREGDSLARESFFEQLDDYTSHYETLENRNFRKTIIALTDEGIEKAKNVILENFDFFIEDKIEGSIIKWAENGNEKAVAIVYDHYDEFKDFLVNWANENQEKAQSLIKENLYIFKDNLINSAIAGKEWSKNIVLDSYYDYFKNKHNLDESIVKWAEEGDERAQKIKEDLDIAKSPIKDIIPSEQEKRDTGGMNPDDFDYFLSLF